MALLPHTSPSYQPASQPQPGKTTCRNNDKTIRGIVCSDRLASTGYDCGNNKVCVWVAVDCWINPVVCVHLVWPFVFCSYICGEIYFNFLTL